ncbi:Cys-tRNA(Pro) deacylase [bacterium LRH843]|nr:Cys-tRNA(Pro) deacylase [bacterium LRH843]
MKSKAKTNATRILDLQKYEYQVLTYDYQDGEITGTAVANKIGREKEVVYKTLVTISERDLFVFVIPVAEELDLKKAAKAAGVKKLDMLPVKEIQKWTGYIRGGCSPIGMKKNLPTFIDERARELEKIIVSAGKIGVQMELKPQDLAESVEAQFHELVK